MAQARPLTAGLALASRFLVDTGAEKNGRTVSNPVRPKPSKRTRIVMLRESVLIVPRLVRKGNRLLCQALARPRLTWHSLVTLASLCRFAWKYRRRLEATRRYHSFPSSGKPRK